MVPARPAQNFVRQEFARQLDTLARETRSGIIFAERVRLTIEPASLSIEPELMYISTERVRIGLVQIHTSEQGLITEVEGPPDMILGSVTDSSNDKEVRLEELCFAGGVEEYWRIGARERDVEFDILRRDE